MDPLAWQVLRDSLKCLAELGHSKSFAGWMEAHGIEGIDGSGLRFEEIDKDESGFIDWEEFKVPLKGDPENLWRNHVSCGEGYRSQVQDGQALLGARPRMRSFSRPCAREEGSRQFEVCHPDFPGILLQALQRAGTDVSKSQCFQVSGLSLGSEARTNLISQRELHDWL